MVPKFINLFDFINYIEFCPICRKRLELSVFVSFAFQTDSWKLNNNCLNLFSQYHFNNISIDLINNSVVLNGYFDSLKTSSSFTIFKECKKYHFYYSGTCNLLKNKLIIDDIILEKYHFIRILPISKHFVVNTNFTNNTTTVILTTDYVSKEWAMPIIDFDFSSKKKIDNKLKTIQLLG